MRGDSLTQLHGSASSQARHHPRTSGRRGRRPDLTPNHPTTNARPIPSHPEITHAHGKRQSANQYFSVRFNLLQLRIDIDSLRTALVDGEVETALRQVHDARLPNLLYSSDETFTSFSMKNANAHTHTQPEMIPRRFTVCFCCFLMITRRINVLGCQSCPAWCSVIVTPIGFFLAQAYPSCCFRSSITIRIEKNANQKLLKPHNARK